MIFPPLPWSMSPRSEVAHRQRQAKVHSDNVLKPVYWFVAPKRHGSFPFTSRLQFGGSSPSESLLGIALVLFAASGWAFLHLLFPGMAHPADVLV